MNIGDMGVPFIYQGEELIYPEYVKDGLVLHYDFSGMTNNDASKDIARDLSGNGNHGTLQNFNFTPESGYDKNKLLLDGTDDNILTPKNESLNIVGDLTLEMILQIPEDTSGYNWLLSTANSTPHARGYSLFIEPLNPLRITFGYKSRLLRTGEIIKNNKPLSVIGVSGAGENKIYINGLLIDTIPYRETEDSGFLDLRIGRASYYSSPLFKGGILSTKVYKKALSPEEIAHNYAIEKERFGIE